MKNKISIIIPTYNSESYITRCLDSLKKQTLKPYEILIVNDGSTDNTLEVLEQYKELDKKIITIKNHGQGYARNMALQKATGDYIFFIDSDDTISFNAIEKLTKIIEDEEADVVNFDYSIVNLNGETKKYNRFSNQPYKVSSKECSILLSNPLYFTVNNLYRREFLIDNDIKYGEGYIYEDYEFWVKVSLKAKQVIFLKEELYQVIKEETSTTNSNILTDKHYKSFLIAARTCLEYTKNISDKNIGYMNRYLLNRFLSYYANRTPKQSKKQFLHDFVDLINEYKLESFKNRIYNLLIKFKVFKNKKYFTFYIFTRLYCLKRFKK